MVKITFRGKPQIPDAPPPTPDTWGQIEPNEYPVIEYFKDKTLDSTYLLEFKPVGDREEVINLKDNSTKEILVPITVKTEGNNFDVREASAFYLKKDVLVKLSKITTQGNITYITFEKINTGGKRKKYIRNKTRRIMKKSGYRKKLTARNM